MLTPFSLMAVLSLVAFDEGLASEIFNEPAPLQEVVTESTVIAVVSAAKPARRDDALQVPGHPNDAYPVSLQRVTVEKLVKVSEGAEVKVGTVLEVAPGDTSALYDMHVEYLNNAMESPIVSVYDTPFDSAERPARWLVFVRPCFMSEAQRWCLTVSRAEERVAELGKVEALVADPPRSPGVSPPQEKKPQPAK